MQSVRRLIAVLKIFLNSERTDYMNSYTKLETVFAWLCLVVGYVFCRVFPAFTAPMGAMIFIIALFIAVTLFLKLGHFKLTPVSIAVAISGMLMAVSVIFTSNRFLQEIAYVYSLASLIFYIYLSTKPKVSFSALMVDFVYALTVCPVLSFTSLFKSISSSKHGVNLKLIRKIALGIAVAFIPTLIVFALLLYDSKFQWLILNIGTGIGIGSIFMHIGSIILGIPVAMYLYSAYITSTHPERELPQEIDELIKTESNFRFAPVITVVSAVIPVLAVYVLFFVSQFDYYVSAFTGVLPKGISYSEYAREGFFQLCAVSVINLAIIICVKVFIKRKTEKAELPEKIIATLFSLFTLLLIATALSKMVLYIDFFGLTPLRVYASWFIVVLALIFIIVLLGQFIKRMPTLTVSAICVVASFMILSFSNPDAIIANYNVDRFINYETSDIDVESLICLGDSAYPALVKLADFLESRDSLYYDEYIEAKEGAEGIREFPASDGFFAYTIPRLTIFAM